MKPFAPGADMAGLAGAIIKGCAGLVPGNQLPVLIELLNELQHHDSASAGGAVEPRAAPTPAPVPAAAAAGRNPAGAAVGRAAPAVASAGSRGSFTGAAAQPTRPVTASRRTASDSGYGGHAGATDGKDGGGDDHRYGHQTAGHSAGGAAGARPPSHRAAASLGAPSGGSGGGASAAALLEAEAADEDSGDEGSRIARVDDYAEALYEEDMNARMAGARMLLALAKQPRNLRELCDNGTLLGMLGRVLREDWRKNVDLTVLLMQFFFCLSHFSQLHGTLSELRIGDLAMRMVELEHRRYTARRLDHERLHRLAELQAAGDREGEAAFRAADAEARKAEEAAAEAAAASAAARASAATSKAERNARRTASLEGGGEGEDGYDDEAEGDGAGGGGSGARSGGGAGGGAAAEAAEVLKRIKLKPLPPGAVDVDKEWRKGRVLNRKQEGLLFVCLSLLMNLAEDVAIERKMCKRNVVGLLVPLLERDNPALLLLAVAFLRKLSIFEENKDAMAALDVAPKLAALLPEPHTLTGAAAASVSPVVTQLQVSVLHLIFNLTFDREMCGQFVAGGVLAKLPAMLKVPAFRSTGIKTLYHLTQDLAVRGAMAATDAPALVLKLVTAFPQATLPLELAALGINLAMDHATAERVLLAAGEAGMKVLVSRAVKSGDVLLLKMLRGLAQHTYAAQADECLKAAAAEEEAWRRAAEEEAAAERAARSARRGASVGAGAASDSKRGGGGDGKEDEEPHEEEPDEEEEAPLQIPPLPDEAIEYDYSAAGLWAGGVRDLLRFAVKSEDKPEVLVETLGLLASLTALDLPESLTPAGVLEDASFLAFLERRLSLGAAAGADDDVLLEAVQLLAALALDADAAGVIAASRLPALLGDLLAEKVADTDMLLQVVCAVLRLLHHEPSRDAIVGRTRIPQRVVELLGHACDQLAADAEECVYIMIVSAGARRDGPCVRRAVFENCGVPQSLMPPSPLLCGASGISNGLVG